MSKAIKHDKYSCPECESTDLNVVVRLTGIFRQSEVDAPDVEIIHDSIPDWDDYSEMSCNTCGHSEDVWAFEIDTGDSE